jgi:hypothetical protein
MFWASKLHGATFGIVLHDEKNTRSKIEKIQYDIEQYGENLGIEVDEKHKNADSFRINTLNKQRNGIEGFVTVLAGSGAAKNTFVSQTLHYLHISEAPRFTNPEALWDGIKPTLTQTEGMVQMEATPNGYNLFRDLYLQAKNAEWTCQTDFAALFYPWTSHKEYAINPPKGWEPCEDDIAYMSQYGISLSQAYWRRKVGFEGNLNPTKKQSFVFAREYPASDETCWSDTVEASPFQIEALKKMILTPQFITEKLGVRVYEQAKYDKHYFMGIDIAEGDKVKKGDDNAFAIVDQDGEICVLYNSSDLSYLEYGALVLEYAERYRPHVIIEINKDYGAVIADYLESANYPKNQITRFRTTGTAQGTGSKPEVISALDKWIMVHTKIKDEELRQQMVGYTKIKQEQRKNRDDLVMALGFAVLKQQQEVKRERPRSMVSSYKEYNAREE